MKPTAKELLDGMQGMRLSAEDCANDGLVLAVRVRKVLEYCDEGFHECIAEHLKEVRRILNGEEL